MTLYLPINVDLSKPYPLKVMNVPQFNTGRGALVALTVEGQVVVPDEESLYIYAKKPDGTMVYADCSMDGTRIKVDFGEQMTAVAGIMDVEIQMVDSSGNSITTTIFKINIMASNIDYQKITSQDEFLALVSTLAEVNELKKNGLKGDPGKAATLQIGTVTASDPGSDPAVTNSGTEQNAILNFVIPRGEQGPTGPPISTVNPAEATEADSGKAADAYQTKLALDEQNVKITKFVSGTPQAVTNTFSKIEVAMYIKRSDGLVQFYVCAYLSESGLTSNTQKLFSGFPIPLQSTRFIGMLANSSKVARFKIEGDSLYNSYTETNNTQNEVIELSGFYFSKLS